MPLVVCASPGCGALIPRGARGRLCPSHARAADRARGSSTARGYGTEHRARRATVAAALAAGAAIRCARCGSPITAADDWHLDHADDRTRYLGPSHAACNTAAGARARNGNRG